MLRIIGSCALKAPTRSGRTCPPRSSVARLHSALRSPRAAGRADTVSPAAARDGKPAAPAGHGSRALCVRPASVSELTRVVLQPASGVLRTWNGCSLARVHPFDADDEPVCQLRRPGALAGALRQEPRRSHLEAVAQERALRFVGVAVADVHPVGGFQRIRARFNNLAAFLCRSCSGALKNQARRR